jgi:hypothetical protein
MRVIISGPRGWKSLAAQSQKRALLVENWIEGNLLHLQEKGHSVVAATTLLLGMDTLFAEVCYKNNIPYDIFLACPKQHEFWDEEAKRTFEKLRSEASQETLISEDIYTEGCINEQAEAITRWLLESPDDKRVMLLLKSGRLSKTQTERVAALRQSATAINVFNW